MMPRALRFLGLPALLALLCAAPGCDKAPSESEIREEIEKARICLNDFECINLGSRCPFGCAVAVTRSEAERIRALLNEFESTCAYGCAQVTEVVCEKGLCTAR